MTGLFLCNQTNYMTLIELFLASSHYPISPNLHPFFPNWIKSIIFIFYIKVLKLINFILLYILSIAIFFHNCAQIG